MGRGASAAHRGPRRHVASASVNYELYMGAALAEAAAAAAGGERADGAVAVVDEAMVARGRPGLQATGDPTVPCRGECHPGGRPAPGPTVARGRHRCSASWSPARCVSARCWRRMPTASCSPSPIPIQGACGSVVQLAASGQRHASTAGRVRHPRPGGRGPSAGPRRDPRRVVPEASAGRRRRRQPPSVSPDHSMPRERVDQRECPDRILTMRERQTPGSQPSLACGVSPGTEASGDSRGRLSDGAIATSWASVGVRGPVRPAFVRWW